MSAIKKIIVHCSDSPDSLDIGVSEIRQWHIKDRGWRTIGYHYVVRRSGIVELGRYENGDSILEGSEIGAHVKGQNSDSLAVCWVGRDRITDQAWSSLIRLLCHLIDRLNLLPSDIFGHYQFDPKKTCPRLDMDRVRTSVAAIYANR